MSTSLQHGSVDHLQTPSGRRRSTRSAAGAASHGSRTPTTEAAVAEGADGGSDPSVLPSGVGPIADEESAAPVYRERLSSGVLVVGAGLIGASLGMALTDAGVDVVMSDRSPGAVALACELGAGTPWLGESTPCHVVLCVPPGATAAALTQLQRLLPNATFSDVASVKSRPQLEAEAMGADLTRFCGAHPIAGRERSGPAAARPDLFVGMPWVLCPSAYSSQSAVAAAEAVAHLAGGTVVEMDAERHDEALALVSHLPQLVASLLAARLLMAPDSALALAGRGLADTSRIAGSDPALWAEVVPANARALLPLLDAFATDLDALRGALRAGEDEAVAEAHDVVSRGNAGHGRLPGKRGRRGPAFREVPVLLDDSPGQLAHVLLAAGELGVNVEDLLLEHAPGRPLGVAVLSVRPEQEEMLRHGLAERGWPVRDIPT